MITDLLNIGQDNLIPRSLPERAGYDGLGLRYNIIENMHESVVLRRIKINKQDELF